MRPQPIEPAWSAQTRQVLPSSSKPMLGGLGRDARVRAALEVLNAPDRRMVASALDELSRPMTARELDEALIASGLSRGDRKRLVGALKGFRILLVTDDAS